jgi:hypothetical protein
MIFAPTRLSLLMGSKQIIFWIQLNLDSTSSNLGESHELLFNGVKSVKVLRNFSTTLNE